MGIESGPVKSRILSDVENCDVILEHFQIDMSSEISVTVWVKLDGIEYHTGLIFLHWFCR